MAERGMGRGLAAILSGSPSAAAEGEAELRELPIDLIVPNPRQPRRSFDGDALASLSGSLRERGVLQPVLVRPVAGGTYELIAGERRWRAATLAGFETIPALVRAHGDAESLEIALVENMARQDLNPVEEARACALLVDELGVTREELARRVGRSRPAISNLMRLLDLPDEALDLIQSGRLSEGHGRALLLADDHDARRKLARQAVDQGWTVRHTEDRARAANGTAAPRALRRRRRDVSADQEAAAAELADVLVRALGTRVRVAPRGSGYSVTLTLASHDEAVALAERLNG